MLLQARRATAVFTLSFSCLVLISGASLAQDRGSFRPNLSLKLSAGYGYAAIGDINRHIKAFDDYMADSLSFYEGGMMRGIGHIIPDFEAELSIRISPRLDLALGTGYISGSRKDDFQTVGRFPIFFQFDADDVLYEFDIEPKVRAIPLKLGLYYSWALTPRIDLLLNAGSGLYFSKAALIKSNDIHYLNANTIPEMPYVISQDDVSGTGLGFHGGIGLEYRLTRGIFLVLDVQGRYARVGKLSGIRTYGFLNYHVDGPQGGTDEGTLYIGTRDMTAEGYGDNCPDLAVSSSPTMKRASLDLSGVSLRAGFRIKLF